MLLSPERRDERRIDQITGGYFGFESSRLNFLLDRRDDTSIEYPAVEWERAAVLIVSGRGLPGIEADVLPQTFDAVVPGEKLGSENFFLDDFGDRLPTKFLPTENDKETLCQLGHGFRAEMDIFSDLGYAKPKLGSKVFSRFTVLDR